MIRLLGIFTGSAISIGAILLVLGLPEIRMPSEPQPQPAEIESPQPAPVPAPVPVPVPVAVPVAEISPQPATPVEIKWHSFWSPFGSQIAANGFVSRLESVTGYDYRVVKTDTGVYEVAFGYADESERRTKLSVIASATGLELPDS
jgi:hypothetical protein